MLGYAVTSEVYGFPADYWDNYAAQVMKVTPADIQRVAKKYVNAGAIQVVAVGDASKIKTWLEKYGTVEVSVADAPTRQGR
jgi:zinc protease